MPHQICSTLSTQFNSLLETKQSFEACGFKRGMKEGALISFQAHRISFLFLFFFFLKALRKHSWHSERALDWLKRSQMSACPHIHATLSFCLSHFPPGYFALCITTCLLIILYSVIHHQLQTEENKSTGNNKNTSRSFISMGIYKI